MPDHAEQDAMTDRPILYNGSQIRAMPAGAELDRIAAEVVMQWRLKTAMRGKFSPSTNIAEAWDLVERITDPAMPGYDGMAAARFSYWWDGARLWADHASGAALDITRAAILARTGPTQPKSKENHA